MAKQEIKLTGKLELEINADETRAKIIFRPQDSQEVWTTEEIHKLLLDNKLANPVAKLTIENALHNWSKGKESEYSLVVASGVPAEKTSDESLEWNKFPFPGSLEDSAVQMYANAPAPEVYKIISKKIKVEKTVKQKSLLPFLGGKKEEKVNSWEVKEERIKGQIQFDVKHKGFVNPGDVIGTIIMGKIGKPGKNIYNKVIPPRPIDKIDFYCGQGVSQVKTKIIANYQGFLRGGENWADILPFRTHSFSVKSSIDGQDCLLSFKPGGKADYLPLIDKIYLQAAEIGFKQTELVERETLRQWLTRAVQEKTEIKNQFLNISHDGFIEISISSDKSQATLNLSKGSGTGKKLRLAEIGKEINQLRMKNLDRTKLKEIILNFYNSSEKELLDYDLAKGVPATRGSDGKLDFLCSFAEPAETTAYIKEIKKNFKRRKLESEHKFPIENIVQSTPIEKETLIARIVPPSYGESGTDIYGQPIPPARGNDPDIRLYENVILSKNEIISQEKGILELGRDAETTLLRVRIKEEASWEISLSEKKTKAFLTISPPRGVGKPASLEDIQKAISESGITQGLEEKLIPELVTRAAAGEHIRAEVIAKGKPPINGSGQRLLFHVKINTNQTENQKNSDYTPVDENKVIAEIFPPAIPPQDGLSVTGEIMKAGDGVVIDLKAGANVRTLKTEQGTVKFVATKSGEILYDGKTISINPQEIVKGDVGPMTGNLSIPSSLRIEGSVYPGFKVFSKGNILVDKKIKQAILSADGSIRVKDQIIGKQRTVLRAKKNIRIKAASGAILLAVGDIFIEEICLHSNTKCNGILKTPPGRGVLAGGEVKARKGLDVHTLGNKEGQETKISFGQDYLISDQIEIEEKKIKKLNEQIALYDKQMQLLEEKSENNKEKLFQIRKAKRQAYKLIEKRNYRLFMLREKFEEHYPSRITVRGVLYPGVRIESHGRNYQSKTIKKKIVLFFNTKTGKIEEKPLI